MRVSDYVLYSYVFKRKFGQSIFLPFTDHIDSQLFQTNLKRSGTWYFFDYETLLIKWQHCLSDLSIKAKQWKKETHFRYEANIYITFLNYVNILSCSRSFDWRLIRSFRTHVLVSWLKNVGRNKLTTPDRSEHRRCFNRNNAYEIVIPMCCSIVTSGVYQIIFAWITLQSKV